MYDLYNFQAAKNKVERLHLDYLCSHFGLRKKSGYDLQLDGRHPDLFSEEPKDTKPKFVIEMKSRTYPKNHAKKIGKSKNQYKWWTLTKSQIDGYETISDKNGLDLFWIFLLGHTDERLFETVGLCEESILHREVYVLPWDACNLVKPSLTSKKHLGFLRHIKGRYDFNNHEVEKGDLWIAQCIADDVNSYFLADRGACI